MIANWLTPDSDRVPVFVTAEPCAPLTTKEAPRARLPPWRLSVAALFRFTVSRPGDTRPPHCSGLATVTFPAASRVP